MKSRFLFAACVVTAAGSVHADEWQWSLTPYIWATDVGLDVSLRDHRLVDATIDFDDLVQDLDSAVLFRAQAMHGAHGVALDVFDVVVTDDGASVPLPGGSGGEVALDARVGTTIVDLTGVYDFGDAAPGWSLRYGARVLNQREDLAARLVTNGEAGPVVKESIDDTCVDALVGLRYAHALSDRWSYEVAVDVSAGGTDFTWSINPSLAYGFGARQQYRAIAGYRYLAIDFASPAAIDNDMSLSGVLVGLQFNF